jgi:hypothetical protein
MRIFWAGDTAASITRAMFPRSARIYYMWGWFAVLYLLWLVLKGLVWFWAVAAVLLANLVTIVLYPLFWGLAVVTQRPRRALAGRWAYVDDWFRSVYYRAYR